MSENAFISSANPLETGQESEIALQYVLTVFPSQAAEVDKNAFKYLFQRTAI